MCTLQIVLSLFVVNKRNGLVMYFIFFKATKDGFSAMSIVPNSDPSQSLCNTFEQITLEHSSLSSSTNLESKCRYSEPTMYQRVFYYMKNYCQMANFNMGNWDFCTYSATSAPKSTTRAPSASKTPFSVTIFICPQSISKMLTRSAILAAVVSLHCSPNTVYLLLTFSSISFSWPSLLPTCRTEPTTRRSSSTGCPSTRSPPP